MLEIVTYVTFSIAFLALAIPLWMMMFCSIAMFGMISNTIKAIVSMEIKNDKDQSERGS
jgi:hypothetical protein